MRKLKLFFACLLMAVLSIGQVWGAETQFSWAGSSTADGGTTDYVVSVSPITLTFSQGTNTSNAPRTNKEGAVRMYTGTTLTISSTAGNITRVVFTPTTNSYQATNLTYNSVALTGNDWTLETPAASVTLTATANARFKTIVVHTADGSDPVAVTGVTLDQSEAEVAVGKTITLIPTIAPSEATNKAVTWESDDEDIATVANGVVTGVAEGIANITVKTVDGNKTATCEVTVTPAPAAASYELVTSLSELADGNEIIIVNEDEDKAIGGQNSSNRAGVAVSATNHTITPGDDVQIIILEASSSNWKFKVGEDSYLYASSNSSNQLKSAKATTAGDNGVWAITIASDGTATAIAQGANGRNELRYNPNNGSPIFSCYASTSTLDVVKIYKKVDGTVKPSAELSYAAADQKKLNKLGDAFTAPTLVNPHTVAVTYASNNTAVAEVNASTGAVTINAAGVAVITASFAGNDDYKAGDASYTIGVTSHAGTQADPYIAADVKIVIDAVETLENAYATGIVSNVVTTELPSEGYITFYFSADGLTSGQQIEAYKCYGLNSAQFEAVSDVVTGATVVVTGNLKKFNSTYEFDQNCHLISYEAPAAPKTHIANDQANPYTVAEAITFAADGVTYDLDDYVYVRGVVYDVKSFNNGAMNIFIKDANAENQFELYKCAGINDGVSTTPFEALTDVRAGNIVIGYGQLTVFNTTHELKQGNYIVDLQKPVTGVTLDATAEVEEGSTVNLTATILPSNATGTIVWSVESGSDKASVEAGVVTGIAEGEATIRATVQGTEIFAECTVTVTATTPALTDYYQKVTKATGVTEGTYLIVYEDASVAFNGALGYDNDHKIDVENNTIGITIVDGDKIAVSSATEASTFYIDPTAGSIQAACGKFIGVGGYSNGLSVSDNADAYVNALSIDDDDNAVIVITTTGGDMTLRYNAASNQARFRYYKSGQQAIQLYKLANEVLKSDPELAWSADVEQIIDVDFTSPTLNHAAGITGTITYSSDNESLATVDEYGVISLTEPHATGTAHITASYPGDANFKAGSAVCTVKINPAHSIYVDNLNVNFGSVTKEATVDDQKVTVTLTGVDAATATLGGTNPEAFSITPAALTASGDITISVASTATAGTYAATLTISDDASEAASKVVNLSLTVTEPEIIDDLTGTWVLATAVPEVGQKFIVAGTYNSVTKTMGIQNTNNRAAVLSTLAENVLTPGEGTKVFTLVDAGEGKYAIQASNGKYLTASGTGTKNYLTEAANYEAANAKWTISVDGEGTASAVASSSNRNNMQYNKSGDGLFSCYSGDQTAIQFYVLQPVTPPEPVYEEGRAGLTAGNYYTICLPKKVIAFRGASIWDLKKRNTAGSEVYLEEAQLPFAAGTPFIIQATATTLEVVYEGDATSTPVENGALRGTLTGMTYEQLNAAGTNIYILKENAIRPIMDGNFLSANRAYIDYDELIEVSEAPISAPGKRVRAIPMQGQTATGMDELNASEAPVKVIIDGQLFIIRGEQMFNANGQLVK